MLIFFSFLFFCFHSWSVSMTNITDLSYISKWDNLQSLRLKYMYSFHIVCAFQVHRIQAMCVKVQTLYRFFLLKNVAIVGVHSCSVMWKKYLLPSSKTINNYDWKSTHLKVWFHKMGGGGGGNVNLPSPVRKLNCFQGFVFSVNESPPPLPFVFFRAVLIQEHWTISNRNTF